MSVLSTNFLGTVNAITAEVYEIGKTNVGKAVDVVSEQAPVVANEYLTWMFWDNAFSAGYSLIVFLLIISIPIIMWLKSRKFEDEQDKFWMLLYSIFPLVFAMLIFYHGVIENVKECVKIKVAPRVVLIEKAVDLFKK